MPCLLPASTRIWPPLWLAVGPGTTHVQLAVLGWDSRHWTLADVQPLTAGAGNGYPGQLRIVCSGCERPLTGTGLCQQVWPEAWSLAVCNSVLGVGAMGQPAKGRAFGDSGNKILWQRARTGLTYTDFCPITSSVVSRCLYISISIHSEYSSPGMCKAQALY